jgi:hypothetical protein
MMSGRKRLQPYASVEFLAKTISLKIPHCSSILILLKPWWIEDWTLLDDSGLTKFEVSWVAKLVSKKIITTDLEQPLWQLRFQDIWHSLALHHNVALYVKFWSGFVPWFQMKTSTYTKCVNRDRFSVHFQRLGRSIPYCPVGRAPFHRAQKLGGFVLRRLWDRANWCPYTYNSKKKKKKKEALCETTVDIADCGQVIVSSRTENGVRISILYKVALRSKLHSRFRILALALHDAHYSPMETSHPRTL